MCRRDSAKSNAALNGVENAEFLCADSAEGFSQVLAREPKIDLVVVDPPRKGLSKEVIGHIAKAVPGRVVYVSCDPATLARDLVLLSEKGYEASFVQPVDMFPQTTHCLLYTSGAGQKKTRHVYRLYRRARSASLCL